MERIRVNKISLIILHVYSFAHLFVPLWHESITQKRHFIKTERYFFVVATSRN